MPMLSIALVLFLVLAFGYYMVVRRRSLLPLPPGPPKLPLIGNLLSMPSSQEWETYHKWAVQLNTDIVHVSIGSASIVILDTEQAARDLLDKRSSIYSSRAKSPMVHDLMGWGDHFGLMSYGHEWRTHRRIFHREFHIGAAPRFYSTCLDAAHGLLRRLAEDPEHVMEAFNYMAPAAILSITYGIDTRPWDDPYIDLSMQSTHTLSAAAVPGAFLVNSIPALKYVPEWFPGAGFKKQAREWSNIREAASRTLFAAAKRNAQSSNPKPSFVSFSLQRLEDGEDVAAHEEILRSIGTTMSTAAADPIASALGNLVLFLLDYPEVQAKAHAELDSHLKRTRLPDFGDRDSLPYVTAVVKELLRASNITPVGVPHYLEVDDIYRGYRIPAGSVVVYNHWAMLHDEDVYPDPFTFNPDRYLQNGVLKPETTHDTAVFGFGRRVCPGQHVGFALLWVTVASLLSVFEFRKAVDEHGDIIEPVHDFRAIIVNTPEPFACMSKLRFAGAETLINKY